MNELKKSKKRDGFTVPMLGANRRGTNFENISVDSREILASKRILGPTKY